MAKTKRLSLGFILIVMILLVAIIFLLYRLFAASFSSNEEEITQKSEIAQDMLTPFAATAQIKLGEVTMLADINKTSVGEMTFSVIEPVYLRDMIIRYDKDKINVSYKGVGVDIDDDSAIVESVVGVAIDTINSAANDSGINVSTDNGAITVTGENENGNFELILNENTHSIMRIAVPNLDFECEFTDFIFAPVQEEIPSESVFSPVD